MMSADVIFLVTQGKGESGCLFRVFTLSAEHWALKFETSGFIGKNGINHNRRREGDLTTPGGVYPIKEAFGILPPPSGMKLPYTKINHSHFWDGNPKSSTFNRLVEKPCNPGEHLIEYQKEYRYCLNIGFNLYNPEPEKGFGIFLHCIGDREYTAGCVAIPKEDMVKCLQIAGPNTYIIIK